MRLASGVERSCWTATVFAIMFHWPGGVAVPGPPAQKNAVAV